MTNLHPLKPVVCNDTVFADVYNKHEDSLFQTSSSMNTDDVIALLNDGAQIDTLVLVNGQGEELVYHIGEKVGWDAEKLPKIIRVNVPEHTDLAVEKIHRAIHLSSVLNVWAG